MRLGVELSICDIISVLKKVPTLEPFRLKIFLIRDNVSGFLSSHIYLLTLDNTVQLRQCALKSPALGQLLLLASVTSLSSWDDVVVITPVVGCIVNKVGGEGRCSRMEYLSRVCIVSGSSLSVAQTSPTTEPAEERLLLSFQALMQPLSLISLFPAHFRRPSGALYYRLASRLL